MDALRYEDYSVYFKVKREYYVALDRIDLAVEDGEFVAVIGPSGCGKTTLLRSAMGLASDLTTGDVFLYGKSVRDVDVTKESIGYISQEYNLYPSMTVFENLAYPLKVMGTDSGEVEARVKAMAEQLGLALFLTRKPRQLSGGQQQRLALGRLLIKEPRLAIFDEPFSNVAPDQREELRAIVRDYHRETRPTVLFVTHDLSEALELADRVVVMDRGEIKQVALPAELAREGATP